MEGTKYEYPVKYWYNNGKNDALSTPMPTLDTKVKESKEFVIKIQIKNFKDDMITYNLHVTCEVRASHMSNSDGKTDIETGDNWTDLIIMDTQRINSIKHTWRKIKDNELTSVPPVGE